MSSTYCTLYVLRLVPPGHFYVGTTTRPFKERLKEHKGGHGAIWTGRHGVHSVVEQYLVPLRDSKRLEDDRDDAGARLAKRARGQVRQLPSRRVVVVAGRVPARPC